MVVAEANGTAKDAKEEESKAVKMANDILSGKYDARPLDEALNLGDIVFDLDEGKYGDLMAQVDIYLTDLTKKEATRVLGS